MSITVVVTNYLRPVNVRYLMDALCKQSVKPTIFIWDNSPAQDFNDAHADWIIRSSRNARCSPRWWMASHADTDFVVIHDDDLMPANPKVLGWTLDTAMRVAPFAVGYLEESPGVLAIQARWLTSLPNLSKHASRYN